MKVTMLTELEGTSDLCRLVTGRDVVLMRTDARYGDGVKALYDGKVNPPSDSIVHRFIAPVGSKDKIFVYHVAEAHFGNHVHVECDGSLFVPSTVVSISSLNDDYISMKKRLELAGMFPESAEAMR